MKRFVEGEDRRQGTLLPEYLEDYVSEENPVRVIDVFVDELDLQALGFAGVVPEVTGRPSYHPGLLLKIYVYSYINQIASTRRLERDRRHAGQAGPQARRHAHPPGYRRTRLRHAQSLDGGDALPHPDARKGQNGDEPARPGLQSEAVIAILGVQPFMAAMRA